MGQQDAVEGQGGEPLGPVVVALLGGGQQRVQHLDGRLEHLDELHDPLVRLAQRARVGVSVGIILGKVLQHADIHLADQRGDVLVVVIARFGLGDGNLVEDGGIDLLHLEFGDVATKLVQSFGDPGDMMGRR